MTPLRIFYDGGCRVCAWEVDKYLARDTRGLLGTIDINAPDFDAARYGLDPLAVRTYFHVLTSEGKVLAGVPAFVEIWKALDTPAFRFAVKAAALPLVSLSLRLGYSVFVRIRPYLPRKPYAPKCDDGSCDFPKKPTA